MNKQFLLKKITLNMFINLDGSARKINCRALIKKVGCTYSHGINLLNKLENMKLVSFIKNGREKFVTLTPVGYDVRECLIKISFLIKNDK